MAPAQTGFDHNAEKAGIETFEYTALAESGDSENGVDAAARLQLDSRGLPLVPQPSRLGG